MRRIYIILLAIVPIITHAQEKMTPSELSAYRKGDAALMLDIGKDYENKEDWGKADDWYRKAYHAAISDKLQNHLEGAIMRRMAIVSRKIDKQKKEQEKQEKRDYENEARTTNNSLMCYNMAMKYKGKNDKKAIEWFLHSVMGEGAYSFNSKYQLGILYMEGGKGVNPDYNRGTYWLYSAMNEGRIGLGMNPRQTIEDYKQKGLINDHTISSLRVIDEEVQMMMPESVDRIKYTTKRVNANTFAVIISNEKYKYENQVPFASNDGNIFVEYCKKILGIPDRNIKICNNGTFNQIKSVLHWLKDTEPENRDKKILFYYAGHGIPDEIEKTSYLLPTDGLGSDAASGYSLQQLYNELGHMTEGPIIVFLDACFSGAERSGKMMDSNTRGVAIKVKEPTVPSNVVVLSASQGDQTAYPYTTKKHGMFTYFLLKMLQETKGEVNLYELSSYITKNVEDYSVKENKKLQSPSVNYVPTNKEWKRWKLK